MSRIGRLPVPVPSGVEVTLDGQQVSVKGPKGTLEHHIADPIRISKADSGELEVTRPNDERLSKSLHGLTRTLVANMVTGVTTGYEKRWRSSGRLRVVAHGPTELEFALGFSHPVRVSAPEGITFNVEAPTRFTVMGIDKQQVGEVAANIRKLRKPEPYKGKGVRYAGERVRRKVGKAGK